MNESSYQLAINTLLCSISLKSHFDTYLECQVTVVSKLNFKKRACKKYWFSKKNLFTSWIWTYNLLNASQLHYPWAISAAVFDGMLLEFSPLLRLQPAAECNLITTFTCGDKPEVGGWWVYDVRQLICRCGQSQMSYQCDGRTDDFSALYIID